MIDIKLVSYFWHPQSTPFLNPEDAARARWMDGRMNRLVVVQEAVQKGQFDVYCMSLYLFHPIY